MDAIRGRRSIRTFDGRPVEAEILEKMIDAATYAPSRWNIQPWRFHIASGESRARVIEVMALNTAYVQEYLDVLGPEFVEQAARFYADLGGAPVVIAVSAEHADDPVEALDDTISVGAAMEHFLLAGVELGVSTCSLTAPHWIKDKLLTAFEIPEGSDLMALIIAGYANEEPHAKERHTDVAVYLK